MRDLFGILQEAISDGLKAPPVVRYGPGLCERLGVEARGVAEGGVALLVVGGKSARRSGLLSRAMTLLAAAGFHVQVESGLETEPTVEEIQRMTAVVRALAPSVVVGLGGGSVLDAAKAVAALATNPGQVQDYLEGVGRGWSLGADPCPWVAVPTAAGTGAEMTKNAVIGSATSRFKKSMRDKRMLARAVLLDPELTCSVPASVTAAGGMDTLAQLMEPCLSVKRTPATTRLAHHALAVVATALPRACEAPRDIEARGALLLASAISGVCLANAGLGLAHGIASGVGGRHAVSHGLLCGILLPHALRHNRSACETELAEALRCFLGEARADAGTIDRGIAAIERLKRRLGIPEDLKFLRLSQEERRAVAEASMGSSMSGNPLPMDSAATDAFLARLC